MCSRSCKFSVSAWICLLVFSLGCLLIRLSFPSPCCRRICPLQHISFFTPLIWDIALIYCRLHPLWTFPFLHCSIYRIAITYLAWFCDFMMLFHQLIPILLRAVRCRKSFDWLVAHNIMPTCVIALVKQALLWYILMHSRIAVKVNLAENRSYVLDGVMLWITWNACCIRIPNTL